MILALATVTITVARDTVLSRWHPGHRTGVAHSGTPAAHWHNRTLHTQAGPGIISSNLVLEPSSNIRPMIHIRVVTVTGTLHWHYRCVYADRH
jgi:hypothetical protein